MRALPVGGGVQDQALELFRVPAAPDEFARQPVKKKGVARKLAPDAEILGGLHQAGSEELLPEAIDRDPSGERITGIDEPFREIHACRGLSGFLQGGQKLRSVARDQFAGVIVLSAFHAMSRAHLLALLHHHRTWKIPIKSIATPL